jgi:5-methyltetrahydropteroyltriglutamate--homocysteine methyltransferase
MHDLKAPFRYDIIGSFLRPEELKAARKGFQEGRVDQQELKKIEDRCIRELVDHLVACGYPVVTDGEFRRGWYHSDFLAGLKGIRFTTYKMDLFGVESTVGSTVIESRLGWDPDHPFLEHFKYLKTLADERGVVPKLDIPGPNIVLLDSITTDQENYYGKDIEALAQAFTDVYRSAIQAFYEAGCRYLQLDDPIWVSLCDQGFRAKIQAAGFDIETVKSVFAQTARNILAAKPADMAITTHLCQGNLLSRKFYDATYDEIADTIFSLPFDGFFMEFDDEKYCDFRILRKLQGQKIVLGVVSTRSSELEDKQLLLNRVRAAAEYCSPEQICVSTQCGFASTMEGNLITEEAQWAKLALVKEIAEEVWG